jgi:hypothetical protein
MNARSKGRKGEKERQRKNKKKKEGRIFPDFWLVIRSLAMQIT